LMSGQYPDVTSASPLLFRSVPFVFLYDCHTSLEEQYYLFVLFLVAAMNKAYLFYYEGQHCIELYR